MPGQYLTHLARSLHSRLSEGNHSEQAQGLALDRSTNFSGSILLSVEAKLFQVRSNSGGSHEKRWRCTSRQGAGNVGPRLAAESAAHDRSIFVQLA